MRLKIHILSAALTFTVVLVGPTAAQRQPFGGLNPPQPDSTSSQTALPWPTKAALLEATRNGEFRGLPEIRMNAREETAPLTASVIHVLRTEYGVPPVPGDPSGGLGTCRVAAGEEIRRLLTEITALSVETLSDRPPNFHRQTNQANQQHNILTQMARLGQAGGHCTTKVMGVEKPHPYGEALVKLAYEFDAATNEFVDAERGRRVASYQAEQARIEADQAATASRQRATDQQRIDAERARIEADQKRRQKEKARVAG